MRQRIGNATDSIPSPIGGESGDGSDAGAPGGSDSGGVGARSLLGRLVAAVAAGVGFVLRDLWRYVKANDLDLSLSDHRVQLEGDDDGLALLRADLGGIVAGRDLRVHYERDGGVDVELERRSNERPLTFSL